MKIFNLKTIGITLILLSLTIAVLVYGRLYYKRYKYDVLASANKLSDNPKETSIKKLFFNLEAPDSRENESAAPSSLVPNPVSLNFGLVIPKINLSVPVIANVSGAVGREYFEKLKYGVAHQKDTPTPDKKGNTVIFGHSSAVPGVTSTQYSEAFLLLDKLNSEDEIEVYYKQNVYRYRVDTIREISEGEVSIVNNTKDKRLTIYTCWPPGTDLRRLVVTAKAI